MAIRPADITKTVIGKQARRRCEDGKWQQASRRSLQIQLLDKGGVFGCQGKENMNGRLFAFDLE